MISKCNVKELIRHCVGIAGLCVLYTWDPGMIKIVLGIFGIIYAIRLLR